MFSRGPAFGATRIRFIPLLSGLLCLAAALAFFPPPSRARLASLPQDSAPKKGNDPGYVPGQILVRYRNEGVANLKQRATTSLKFDGRSIALKVERFGGSDLVPGLRIAKVDAEDTLAAIAALEEDRDVLYAEPDYLTQVNATPNDMRFGEQYGLQNIGAPAAWDTTTGSTNIVVGIVDEGVDISHQDLQANIWTNPAPGSISGISGDLHGYDFAHDTGSIPAEDHATHVAGIVGAVGNNGIGVTGVNWQTRLMSLKTLSQTGGISEAVRAFSYVKQMKDLWVSSGGTAGANVRVLNNSWSQRLSATFSQSLFDSISALNAANILFVAAAGNFPEDPNQDNDQIPFYPAGYDVPNIIAVASTLQNDNLFDSSHYGANSVDLGAPGVGILSTTPGNNYALEGGTSMATPHVTGAAALLLAANPNLTVQQLKNLLLLNGDSVPSLDGKTLSGRRLNVAKSLAALAENDTTLPGTATNFGVTAQDGRTLTLGWTTSGDDGANGQAALYQVSFTDTNTGAVIPLRNVVPPASGNAQTVVVKLPYRHTRGRLNLREFDNVGNEGTPATVNVTISFAAGDPYALTLGPNSALSTGGTHLNLNADDAYRQNYSLPFPFPFFGTVRNSVTISTNGNLYFGTPPPFDNQDGRTTEALTPSNVIAGLWDDLYLGTDQRSDADVYDVRPDANTIIFRWQGVPCNAGGGAQCEFGGAPVNFEIELKSNGQITMRYGSGNTNLNPVVGVSGGEPEVYSVPTHTSPTVPKTLTNARNVTFIPRATVNPADNVNFFVSQHYRDFLNREPDTGGLTFWTERIAGNASNNPPPCAPNDAACVNERRIGVSDAFFVELEYQQTGSFVFRMYRGAFGNSQPFPNPRPDPGFPGEDLKLPSYQVFAADRALVIGGSNLAQLQLDYANAFVQRPSFIAKYPLSLATADQFVDAVLATVNNDIHVDLSSQRAGLITLYNSGGRGAVMYRLADDNVNTNPINNRSFIDAEYNRAFVFGEYSGYLRRNADIPGFMFWLGQVNAGPLRDLTKQHAMVCSFITSTEYQQRFSAIVSHNNTECN
jgi:subtilisin family serine protease